MLTVFLSWWLPIWEIYFKYLLWETMKTLISEEQCVTFEHTQLNNTEVNCYHSLIVGMLAQIIVLAHLFLRCISHEISVQSSINLNLTCMPQRILPFLTETIMKPSPLPLCWDEEYTFSSEPCLTMNFIPLTLPFDSWVQKGHKKGINKGKLRNVIEDWRKSILAFHEPCIM